MTTYIAPPELQKYRLSPTREEKHQVLDDLMKKDFGGWQDRMIKLYEIVQQAQEINTLVHPAMRIFHWLFLIQNGLTFTYHVIFAIQKTSKRYDSEGNELLPVDPRIPDPTWLWLKEIIDVSDLFLESAWFGREIELAHTLPEACEYQDASMKIAFRLYEQMLIAFDVCHDYLEAMNSFRGSGYAGTFDNIRRGHTHPKAYHISRMEKDRSFYPGFKEHLEWLSTQVGLLGSPPMGLSANVISRLFTLDRKIQLYSRQNDDEKVKWLLDNMIQKIRLYSRQNDDEKLNWLLDNMIQRITS